MPEGAEDVLCVEGSEEAVMLLSNFENGVPEMQEPRERT